jgi:hypothetical protein
VHLFLAFAELSKDRRLNEKSYRTQWCPRQETPITTSAAQWPVYALRLREGRHDVGTSFLDRLLYDPAKDGVTHSQLATAICLGVRLPPIPTGRDLSAAITQAEIEAEKHAPANEMQRALAADLGVAVDKQTTRSSLCNTLLHVLHTDPESFESRPSAAFQDRFCGGPFSRFGEWLPKQSIKSDRKAREIFESAYSVFEVLIPLVLVCLPFVALWYGIKALWNAVFG